MLMALRVAIEPQGPGTPIARARRRVLQSSRAAFAFFSARSEGALGLANAWLLLARHRRLSLGMPHDYAGCCFPEFGVPDPEPMLRVALELDPEAAVVSLDGRSVYDCVSRAAFFVHPRSLRRCSCRLIESSRVRAPTPHPRRTGAGREHACAHRSNAGDIPGFAKRPRLPIWRRATGRVLRNSRRRERAQQEIASWAATEAARRLVDHQVPATSQAAGHPSGN